METSINNQANDRSWQKVIMKYNQPNIRKSIRQICNSVIPYFILWYLMVQSLQFSYLLTLFLCPSFKPKNSQLQFGPLSIRK